MIANEQPLPCQVLKLSPEIVKHIAENICEKNHLRNFSNVCRSLHRIINPILYQNVTIRSISSCDDFARTVSKYPARAWDVKTLIMCIPCFNENPEDLDVSFVEFLQRLRELNVRFPGVPKGLIENRSGVWSLALESLRTCTLDLTDTDGFPWSLVDALPFLRHRLLASLTLHNMYSAGSLESTNEALPAASTGLQELNFLSSGITAENLAILLRLPRHLRRLTLGAPFNLVLSRTAAYHTPSVRHIAAMSSVFHTLECLRIIQSQSPQLQSRDPAIGLEKFKALRYLELPSRCFPGTPMPENLSTTISGGPMKFPESLEVLKVTVRDPIESQISSIVKERKSVAPALRRIILSVAGSADFTNLKVACVEAGIEMQVVRESTHVSFHGPALWKIADQIRST